MKKFLHDTHGSSSLWAAFFCLILCTFSILIYTGATIYTKYHIAQTELERAATVSVDGTLENPAIRDLITDVSSSKVMQAVENNLMKVGYRKTKSGEWRKVVNGKWICSFQDLNLSVTGDQLYVSANLSLPLPWHIDAAVISLPITFQSKVLFLN